MAALLWPEAAPESWGAAHEQTDGHTLLRTLFQPAFLSKARPHQSICSQLLPPGPGRMILHSRNKAKGRNRSFHPSCPYQVSPQKLLFLQRLRLIHRTCWGSRLRCRGSPQQVPKSGGRGEGVPNLPLLPKVLAQLGRCRVVFQPRLPHRADSNTRAGASPGAGRVPPPVSHARLPTHLSSSAMPWSPHQLRDIYLGVLFCFFFNPGAVIRANRNGKSAEALRDSTKKKPKKGGEGRQPPHRLFLSRSRLTHRHRHLSPPHKDAASNGIGG